MITNVQFEEWVREGIASLPEWVRKKLVNVAFIVEEELTAKVRKEEELSLDEVLFGLYSGVPLTERGDEPPLFPDVITLFKEPILEKYPNKEDARTCVVNTVWHEVAHYLGHDEDWIEAEEKRRGMEK